MTERFQLPVFLGAICILIFPYMGSNPHSNHLSIILSYLFMALSMVEFVFREEWESPESSEPSKTESGTEVASSTPLS
jgi:hypothetical protein